MAGNNKEVVSGHNTGPLSSPVSSVRTSNAMWRFESLRACIFWGGSKRFWPVFLGGPWEGRACIFLGARGV